MRPVLSLALGAGLMALIASSASAAETTRRVVFEKGASSAKMSGSLKGGGATYYLVNAATGQTLKASLAADSSGCHMKLFAPGDEPGEAEPLFDGSIAGNLFAATLSASGDYTAQVYKVRNAERVNELCRYAVTFEVTGEPGAAPADPPDDPALEADGP